MSEASILFDAEGGIARVTLNRPQSLNSFNEEMHQRLSEAMDRIEADRSVRVLLLTGSGRGFCAGQDLNDRRVRSGSGAPDLGATLENYYNPLVLRLKRLPLPVVCAVNGVAAGAGANLALACDIVIAARSARFIQSFCKLGLIPDSGGTWSLPRLVGSARAAGLSLLGEPLDAARAVEWGLIWKCVEDADLHRESNALAEHFAAQPTAGLGRIKQALLASQGNSLERQLDLERDLQRTSGQSRDYQEGVAAFLEKRAPRFSGL